jgi:hypothetical protein
LPADFPHAKQLQAIFNKQLGLEYPNGSRPVDQLVLLNDVCIEHHRLCGNELSKLLNKAVISLPSNPLAQRSNKLLDAAALGKGFGISTVLAGAAVPNPWGKLGGPAHQAVVQELKDYYESQGYRVQPEVRVETPGGFKPYRYVDLAVYDDSGDLISYNQVGRQTAGGIPVMRETKAMSDLFSVSEEGVEINFFPYNIIK